MRVSAIKNFNLNKVNKASKLDFSGAKKVATHSLNSNSEGKKSGYIPRMLLTMGIGVAILWATARVFKDKTAPLSYLWK